MARTVKITKDVMTRMKFEFENEREMCEFVNLVEKALSLDEFQYGFEGGNGSYASFVCNNDDQVKKLENIAKNY